MAACECLAGLPQQSGGGAAEQEELGRRVGPIRQHAQNLELFWRSVNLVEHHESAAVSQSASH
jgi:hypothetical protein